MKAIPCKLIINSSRGYIFTPVEFPSVRQAVKYGRTFEGGFAWRLFTMDGKLIQRGFCDSSPWNGYRGI
jgi:hypothetical protein